MAGIFPPPLFATTEQQRQQQQLQPTLSPPISPIANTPISDIRQQYYHRDHLRYHHNHSQSLNQSLDSFVKRGTSSNEVQDEDDCPIFQKFHHPQERHHGQHPLNRIHPSLSLHQQLQQGQQPLSGPAVQSDDSANNTDMAWNQQKHQWPPERKFVLSSPPSFCRGRNPSTDSIGSVGSPTPAAVIEKVTLRPTRERPTSAMYKITYGKPWSPSSISKIGPAPITPITPSPTSALSGDFPTSSTSSSSSTYESLLEQVAAQKEKLKTLGSGIKDVTSSLHTLDKTLIEEQESITKAIGETERAIQGWERTWAAYSKCEPIKALQERPTMMASLIQGMGWHEKKAMFEKLVASCLPREIYGLQRQITLHHGQVEGFDLVGQLPLSISTMIIKLLVFKDLSSCRLVSRTWNERVVSYDVLKTVARRLCYQDDNTLVEAEEAALSNWNLLCRYQERDLRWRKVKPVSIQPLLGHSSYVTSVKDRGEWIVSGGYDEKVRLWEASSGKCVKIWETGSAISCVELFIDATMEGGGVVVAAFVDIGVVKVWSLHGPLNMQSLTGHQKGVRAIAINETYLITAGHDQTVVVWHWASGRKVASFRAHNEVIQSVHLSKNTVYSLCIDATLRVFDIPSRILLHQVKLFDVQQGSTLQWSCLRENVLVTATSKKIYIWQMEHLDSLVTQNYHLSQSQVSRQDSRLSLDSSSSADSSSTSNTSTSTSLESRNYPVCPYPPRSPSRSTTCTSLTSMSSEPVTPSVSSVATSPRSEAGSSYFSLVKMDSSAQLSAALIQFEPVETRVKPFLTAVLNMTTDMWCGKITHHDPPMLFLGSRSSAVKLVALPLSKEVIDPDRNYETSYSPVQLFPKTTQVLGMPTGHGLGIMGMDSRSDRLVVGCTGGSIHLLNMDPALRTLQPSKVTGSTTAVVLPQSTPSNMDSPPSLSPVVTSSFSSSPSSPLSSSSSATFSTSPPKTGSIPTKPSAILKAKNTTSVISRSGSSRITIPSPDRSPQAPSMISSPSTLRLRTPSPPRGTRHMKPLIATSHYEEQEVLVDCDDDDDLPIHRQRHPPHHPKPLLQSPPIRSATTATSPRTSTATNDAAPSAFPKGNRIPRRPLVTLPIPPPASLHSSRATSPHSPGATSSCTPAGQAFSRLSKYIPTPPSRIMRRRASSNGDIDSNNRNGQDGKLDVTGNRASASTIMKGRNRSNPDLLNPGNHPLLSVGNRQSWAHSYNIKSNSSTGR